MIDCVIFDIDGTIADNSERLRHITGKEKDWTLYNKKMHADKPMQAMLNQLDIIGLVSPIILLTGRIDSTRKTTIEWLRENGVSYGITANPKKITRKSMCLIMRNDKNNLPNYVYKKNELYKLKALGVNPVLAFDDDDKCRKVFEEFKIDTIDPEIIMKRKGF
jgi:hypothetical protein